MTTVLPIESILKDNGLRDTQPRRLVADALGRLKRPATPQDIELWIAKHGATVNTVTVYRILSLFEQLHVVHRHPCSGEYSLCSLPDRTGHHGFLHCSRCHVVEEFVDESLCREEDRIARRAGFRPHDHVSEILGTCSRCS